MSIEELIKQSGEDAVKRMERERSAGYPNAVPADELAQRVREILEARRQ